MPDVSSVGPIPWLTLPFCTGMVRDFSLTSVPAVGGGLGGQYTIHWCPCRQEREMTQEIAVQDRWEEEGK